MDWWQALILGIAQGLTEFLPVSSSGHLTLLQELMNVEGDDDLLKAFDVAMHAGTFIAVVGYFRHDMGRMLAAWGQSVARREVKTADQRVAWLIFVGTLPAIAAYLFFGDLLDRLDDKMVLVASLLIAVSFVFLLADWLHDRAERAGELLQFEGLRWYHGVFVGIAQAVALIPGTSRSGATIAMSMMLKVDRQTAARFSFLLGTPAVFGALVVKLPDLRHGFDDPSFVLATIVGFIGSVIAGFWAIDVLVKFLGKHRLSWFALYRIPVGIFFLWYFTR
ncbi:MAG: pyrophosphate phosphatase [Thermoleophilia bacterium]|nr:pyrophosphate phosphatase [Thermoleophilia bacterium]